MIAIILLACTSTPAEEEPPPLAPTALDTEAGLYHLDLAPDPDPPTAGAFMLEIGLSSGDVPEEGASLAVTPWMVEMDHGVGEDPVIDELGGGVYQAGWSFPMTGEWQITIEVDGSAGPDTAVLLYAVE